MAYKSIEKTDNFQTVVFDPSPTAPDMQALYEKGWVLHMGPFPVNRGFSALFFRENVPGKRRAFIAFNPDEQSYSVRDAETDEVISHSWATRDGAAEDARAEGCILV